MFHLPLRLIVAMVVAAAAPVFMLGAVESGGVSTPVEHQMEVKVIRVPQSDTDARVLKEKKDAEFIQHPKIEGGSVDKLALMNKEMSSKERGDVDNAIDVPKPTAPEKAKDEIKGEEDTIPVAPPAKQIAVTEEDATVVPTGGPDRIPQPMPAPDHKDANLVTPSEQVPVQEKILADSAVAPVAPVKESALVMTPAEPMKMQLPATDKGMAPKAVPQPVLAPDAPLHPIAVPAPTVTPSLMDKPEAPVMAPSNSGAVKEGIYHNAEKGYSIEFPAGWEIKEGFMGLDVFGLASLKGADDRFRENVNVVTEDLRSHLSLDEYFDLGIKNLKMLLTDFKEVDSGKMDVGGVPARWISYDHRMGEVKARVLQVIFVKGERAYIITATAAPEEFDAYKGSFDTIIKSFSFGGK